MEIISDLQKIVDSGDENNDSGFEGEPSELQEVSFNNEWDELANVGTVSVVTTNANNMNDAYLTMLCLHVGSTSQTSTPMYDPSLLLESVDSLAPAVVRASESVASELYNYIKKFTEMREFVQTIQAKCCQDKSNLVPHQDRTDAEYADYAQNLDMPHFGSEQPGDTYYFSPLGIYVFRIVKESKEPSLMRCFYYKEGVAKKGGNNVASLL